ncbi:uncharacterized protein LAJ45_05488 [Morchella importuna]|uniref:MOSC domain-containing protein n=1 Tax=Morchella conica CCBAS932 TaxID=1392247 RepID=A0A3N4KTP3_9PEZI|nr:uncharacterized protein LAJ45_05488 [Morchella importuna]KAH8150277.1 hypothetical protein LAJ45_05488 [Morchella importuna]RPB13887.1 hypothetical protein P167DRAFT_534517 [Morchella conica CCBAS932]
MAVELPPTVAASSLQQFLMSGAAAVISWLVFTRLLRAADVEPKGEKMGLGPEKSNLADEFQYGPDGDEDWKVKSLWIYPVKSCRGVEVDEVNVVPTGFEHDRQFMFAELRPYPRTGAPEWNFITQRQYPQMALITPTIHTQPKSPTGGTLSITFPLTATPRPLPLSLLPAGTDTRTFQLPLSGSKDVMARFPLVNVKIWKCTPEAYDVSSVIQSELKELAAFLGAKGEVRLFRTCEERLREVYRNAPRKEELGFQSVVGFADAYPVHMLNLASVRELNSKITDKIPDLSVKRFRANIVVSGPKAFSEDDWKKITFGGKMYYAAARTVRCRLPNVNQDTGEKHMQEPDKTMRSYRNIDAGSPKNACLGMQLVPADERSVLRVGEKLGIVETGEHLYIPLFS